MQVGTVNENMPRLELGIFSRSLKFVNIFGIIWRETRTFTRPLNDLLKLLGHQGADHDDSDHFWLLQFKGLAAWLLEQAFFGASWKDDIGLRQQRAKTVNRSICTQ